jgi:putative SOS response-associated peptidase YedK
MCSRFENKETGFSILEKLDKDELGNYILEDDGDLKKEIFSPTNFVFSLIKTEKEFKLKNFLWGIQFDKEKKSPLIFNSRLETIKEKSYWTRLFYKNRCLLEYLCLERIFFSSLLYILKWKIFITHQ